MTLLKNTCLNRDVAFPLELASNLAMQGLLVPLDGQEADVEPSRYGPRLSALVGLLGSAFPLSFGKTQALLDQLLGVEISRGAIAAIRQRRIAALEQSMAEALQAARQQPVAYVDETGAATGNADGGNPERKRGWQWVMVTPGGRRLSGKLSARSATPSTS